MGRRYLELFRVEYNQMAREVGLPVKRQPQSSGYDYQLPAAFSGAPASGGFGGSYGGGGYTGGAGGFGQGSYAGTGPYASSPAPPGGSYGAQYGGSYGGRAPNVTGPSVYGNQQYGYPMQQQASRGRGVPVKMVGMPWRCTKEEIGEFFR